MTAAPGAKSPYRPGAAISPLYLAGREPSMRRFRRTLAGAPEVPANVKLTGLRGVGKTVLLKELERQADEDHGWVTSRFQVEPRHNYEEELNDRLVSLAVTAQEKASRAARIRHKLTSAATAARGLIKVSFEDIEFSFGGGDRHTRTLTQALYEAASAADANGRSGYLLMLDEAQLLRDDKDAGGQHPLSLLIAAVNNLQEAELPIGLVLCGLPTLKANLLKARTYSERMFRGEEIGRLAAPPRGTDAVEAFVKPLEGTGVTATNPLVERVISEVEGYPYFIQLWGDELWHAAVDAGVSVLDERLLDEVEPDIYRRLDSDFYGTRIESLTPAEQDLLMATARCPYPPLRSADIRGNSTKSDGNVNVLMGRLSEQGVVYRTQKGIYEYTAPKFHDYLRRRDAHLTGE